MTETSSHNIIYVSTSAEDNVQDFEVQLNYWGDFGLGRMKYVGHLGHFGHFNFFIVTISAKHFFNPF